MQSADFIICENPKHSLKLLSKFGIKKKLYSLHDHNEQKLITKIEKNAKNQIFALISDAGSPLISDPGFKLVKYFVENGIGVFSIPGPSSVIAALQISSIPCNEFQFLGFAPKTKKSLYEFVEQLSYSRITSVFFSSGKRLLGCLQYIEKILKDRKVCVCKELTKINERKFIGIASKIKLKIEEDSKNLLGEFVVIVEGNMKNEKNKLHLKPVIIKQIIKLMEKFSLTDVVEIVHKITNVSKKQIYKEALKHKNEKS